MNAPTALKQTGYPIDPTAIGEVWSGRYATEGHIWGDQASSTAEIVAENLRNSDSVLEIGFGYGRDMRALLDRGYRVTGVEIALAGLNEATQSLRDYISSGHAHLQLGDFSRAQLPDSGFDAVTSHRVLHLLGNNGLVRQFSKVTADVLKPNGLLVVSARSEEDFNPEQMKWVNEGTRLAEYKGREGHLITFWNEAMFRDVFGKRFDIVEFQQSQELESLGNPVDTHLITMIARKKMQSPLGDRRVS